MVSVEGMEQLNWNGYGVLLISTKASKLAKEYEKQGGDYENEAGSKNEPKKGEPQHKSEGKKSRELEEE